MISNQRTHSIADSAGSECAYRWTQINMNTEIYTALIGGFFGILGASLVACINWKALKSSEKRFREDLDARLATTKAEQANRFKSIALDKRLTFYQEAYSQWVTLCHHLFETDIDEISSTFRTWLTSHSLYLDNQTRSLINEVINHAPHYKTYTGSLRDDAWNKIQSVGIKIMHEVDLAFTPEESELIKKSMEPK